MRYNNGFEVLESWKDLSIIEIVERIDTQSEKVLELGKRVDSFNEWLREKDQLSLMAYTFEKSFPMLNNLLNAMGMGSFSVKDLDN